RRRIELSTVSSTFGFPVSSRVGTRNEASPSAACGFSRWYRQDHAGAWPAAYDEPIERCFASRLIRRRVSTLVRTARTSPLRPAQARPREPRPRARQQAPPTRDSTRTRPELGPRDTRWPG